MLDANMSDSEPREDYFPSPNSTRRSNESYSPSTGSSLTLSPTPHVTCHRNNYIEPVTPSRPPNRSQSRYDRRQSAAPYHRQHASRTGSQRSHSAPKTRRPGRRSNEKSTAHQGPVGQLTPRSDQSSRGSKPQRFRFRTVEGTVSPVNSGESSRRR